jgi:hypothetical protein
MHLVSAAAAGLRDAGAHDIDNWAAALTIARLAWHARRPRSLGPRALPLAA